MELLCIQSQEHPELPLAELKAVMECENIDAMIDVVTEGLVILRDISEDNIDEYYEILTKRLGYTHEVHEIIIKSSRESLNEDICSIDWNNYISETFAVRVKRFKSEIDTVATERKAGALILEHCDNIKVKLREPNSLVRLVAFGNDVYIAIEKIKLNKKHFEESKPHKRPFFYPGSMSPKLALCMVNLAHVKEGDIVLDPFCGTGGILIEAGDLNTTLIASDLEKCMYEGTKLNLAHEGFENFKVYWEDVRKLEIEETVDAVAMDPPYGISTTLGGEDTKKLYTEALVAIEKYLKDDGHICMASPHYIDMNEVVENTPLKILEQHSIRMHKSLTRIITVLAKK